MKKTSDLFQEMEAHLLQDEKPSEYFNNIIENEIFHDFPFHMLSNLKKAEQSPQYHPEGNVWNHTMMVIDAAAGVKKRSKNPIVFMWAALLHDIGKPDTTRVRKGKITSYDHDRVGAEMAEKFLNEFTADSNFIQDVVSLVRWHMQILFVVHNLQFADVEQMNQQTDVNEVALLGFCDRMGRLGANRKQEEGNIHLFLKKCKQVKTTGGLH